MSAVSLVVLSCLLTGVQSRSNGAPPQACANISRDPSVSGHNASPQTSAVPYALTGLPSSGNYTPGMSYTRECPNPHTSAYLTPNCRSQTCLYQCTNSLDEYTALVRRTQAFYTSVFQLTKAYMAGNVLILIDCATLSALKVILFEIITWHWLGLYNYINPSKSDTRAALVLCGLESGREECTCGLSGLLRAE